MPCMKHNTFFLTSVVNKNILLKLWWWLLLLVHLGFTPTPHPRCTSSTLLWAVRDAPVLWTVSSQDSKVSPSSCAEDGRVTQVMMAHIICNTNVDKYNINTSLFNQLTPRDAYLRKRCVYRTLWKIIPIWSYSCLLLLFILLKYPSCYLKFLCCLI